MSYDLAVWEGERAVSDADAAETYERYMELLESGERQPPSERIRVYVDALVARWPDLADLDDGNDTPWASGPLIGEASGSFICFPIVWSRAEEASAYAAARAADHGLVCFDPQSETSRPETSALSSRRGLFSRWQQN